MSIAASSLSGNKKDADTKYLSLRRKEHCVALHSRKSTCNAERSKATRCMFSPVSVGLVRRDVLSFVLVQPVLLSAVHFVRCLHTTGPLRLNVTLGFHEVCKCLELKESQCKKQGGRTRKERHGASDLLGTRVHSPSLNNVFMEISTFKVLCYFKARLF